MKSKERDVFDNHLHDLYNSDNRNEYDITQETEIERMLFGHAQEHPVQQIL